MSEHLPEPLVPADCDLTGFPYMPLFIARLKQSKTWAYAKRKPALAFYQINLWTAAWHGLPAASLEDDEMTLMDAAQCDEKTWKQLRVEIMRGWVKCSDGRLYHPIVAEVSSEAWSSKEKQRQRTEAARQAKSQSRNRDTTEAVTKHVTKPVTDPATEPVTTSVTETVTDPVTASNREEQRVTEKKREERKQAAARAKANGRHPANGAGPPRWDHPAIQTGREAGETKPENLDRPIVNGWFLDRTWERVLEAAGMRQDRCPMTDRYLVGWLKDGYLPDDQILPTIARCAGRANYSPPASLAYFDQAIRELPPKEPPQ